MTTLYTIVNHLTVTCCPAAVYAMQHTSNTHQTQVRCVSHAYCFGTRYARHTKFYTITPNYRNNECRSRRHTHATLADFDQCTLRLPGVVLRQRLGTRLWFAVTHKIVMCLGFVWESSTTLVLSDFGSGVIKCTHLILRFPIQSRKIFSYIRCW